jgi:PD-(D/E)XK nuclease superfamily protein
MSASLSQEELEAAHAWENEDRAPGRPEMTEFRRQTRFHQAQWREANGHAIGTQPMRPQKGKPVRLVGSRLRLDYAKETGANFLTARALEAATARTAVIEPYQTLDHQRMWADLLSSEALAFNLFGDLAADLKLADRAVHTWWPDVPGTVREIRFEHSPGRFDPTYMNSLRAFDAAFVLDLDGGKQGIVAVDTKYHEKMKSEIPRPENLERYLEIAERSGIFARGSIDKVKGRSELAVMWLEHLLMLSMLQHPSRAWSWGRYVVVHPRGNVDIAALCARYRKLLADQSTFACMTLEELLDAKALPSRTTAALRERYLPDGAADLIDARRGPPRGSRRSVPSPA